MKILRMCKDIFDQTLNGTSIKEFFQEMRKAESNSDREFFMLCIGYLGGRGYNEFLDYSLFAIKLNVIFNKYHLYTNVWSRMREAITNLLFDDRHDYFQNGACELDDFAKGFKGEHEDKAEEFWSLVVDGMIECINVNGTGDVSVNFTIPEKLI